jgi:IS30 family transposase
MATTGHFLMATDNRSAIGTLVERTTRYTMLLHLDPASRATSLCDQLITVFTQLPGPLRRSLTWDQGSEMCHHHRISDATAMPVFFCHAGHPWERPSNENTNELLRDYFPKGTNLAVHTPADLARVADELNRRPRKTLDWQTPDALQSNLLPPPSISFF